jgi:hypothetical protein
MANKAEMTAATIAGHIVEFDFINDFDSVLTVGTADLHSEKDPDVVTGQLWHRLRDDSIQQAGTPRFGAKKQLLRS